MRWLLIDDEDDVWIVCDFNIQYFMLIWRFLKKSKDVSHLCHSENHIIVLIVTCYYFFVFVCIAWHWFFGYECLAVDLSLSHLIWYDMLFVYQYVRWETVLSTYLSSNTIIYLIQSLSLSSLYQLGLRALMYAAQGGHVDTVKLLLDSGSDIEKKDNVSTRRCMTTYICMFI